MKWFLAVSMVGVLCTLSVLSCGGRAVIPVPMQAKTGPEFERDYLGSRLHHHAETQNLVNTCIAKSQRLELIAFCKEIDSTAQRVIVQLRDQAREWYGISVAPQASEEHGSELFRSFAERMKKESGPTFDRLTLQALRQQYRQGVEESAACEKQAVRPELKVACTTATKAQETQLRRINEHICSWFQHCSDR